MKHFKHALWALLVPLALSACSSVTPGAPLEPQALILTVTSEHDNDAGSLRAAIEQARSGNTITFANNVRTITLSSELIITKDLTIIGSEGGITISGNNLERMMSINRDFTLNLDGLTIANVKASHAVINFGTLTVTNSTFSDNRTDHGVVNFGTLTVTNSTFSDNRANQFGGGIYNAERGTLTVTNSTFSGNSATYGGGGIDNRGTLTLTNSTIALNTAPTGPDISGTVSTASHNLIGKTAGSSGVTHGVNGNIVTSDPKLGPLADNGGPTKTMALLAGSPAIDAALRSSCPARDQRGVTRPQGNGCDIGAFEREPDPIVVTLSVNPGGTVRRATGAATVSGKVTCSASTSVTLDVALSQAQKQGKTTSTVTGSDSVTVSCNDATPWTATVSGAFKNGSATVSVTEAGSDPLNGVTQPVTLSWVK